MQPAFAPFLLPFAGLYWAGLRFDRWRRRSSAVELNKPVISIGNITVGGTGKTPLLLCLLQILQSHQKKTVVPSRGYKGFGRSGGAADNDEAALVRSRFPHVLISVNPDRVAGARDISGRESIDAFLLDDGFQHWPLKRDLDIVRIDATDPWGGGFLLPAGRLREPRSALERADVIVLNRADLIDPRQRSALLSRLDRYPAMCVVSRVDYDLMDAVSGAKQSLETLRGRSVIALSAIGNHLAFEDTLTRFGATVHSQHFRDHHAYSRTDVDAILKLQSSLQAGVVTTEKDWVKLRPLHSTFSDWSVLKMNLTFDEHDQDVLQRRVLGVFK